MQKFTVELTCPHDTLFVTRAEIRKWTGLGEDAITALIKKKRFPDASVKSKPDLWDWKEVALAMMCLRWLAADGDDEIASQAGGK